MRNEAAACKNRLVLRTYRDTAPPPTSVDYAFRGGYRRNIEQMRKK